MKLEESKTTDWTLLNVKRVDLAEVNLATAHRRFHRKRGNSTDSRSIEKGLRQKLWSRRPSSKLCSLANSTTSS